MNQTMQQPLMLNKDELVALVADAYSMGLVAGQHSCAALGDPDFEMQAVTLFSHGFSAMLSEPFNKLEA